MRYQKLFYDQSAGRMRTQTVWRCTLCSRKGQEVEYSASRAQVHRRPPDGQAWYRGRASHLGQEGEAGMIRAVFTVVLWCQAVVLMVSVMPEMFRHAVRLKQRDSERPEGWPSCRVCGCWEYDSCWDEDQGVACSWVEPDLCSRCVLLIAAAGGEGG